jgi:hypothetical protein
VKQVPEQTPQQRQKLTIATWLPLGIGIGLVLGAGIGGIALGDERRH